MAYCAYVLISALFSGTIIWSFVFSDSFGSFLHALGVVFVIGFIGSILPFIFFVLAFYATRTIKNILRRKLVLALLLPVCALIGLFLTVGSLFGTLLFDFQKGVPILLKFSLPYFAVAWISIFAYHINDALPFDKTAPDEALDS
jgi:hypothetical protein